MTRTTTLKVLSTVLAIMLAITAVSCGGGGEPTPAPPADTPVSLPPTATPVPPSPTPEEGGLLFEYTEYTDPSGVFSIEYPLDWAVDDRSRPDTVSTFWYPEDQSATMSLFLTYVTVVPDPQAQMDALIDEWMIDASGFATDPDYEELSREAQADESILLRFYYTREGEPTQAGCFFETRGSLFSALCFGTAQERWDELVDDFNYIANSYVITPPAAEGPPPGYAEYVHSSGVFSMEYPEGWEVSDTSSAGNVVLTFSPPDGGIFVAPALMDVGTTLDEDNMNTFVDSFLEGGFVRNQDYQELGREVQTDGSLLVRFSYSDPSGTVEAGTFFEQKGTIVSALTVGGLQDSLNAWGDQLDHILNTYMIDETAWPY